MYGELARNTPTNFVIKQLQVIAVLHRILISSSLQLASGHMCNRLLGTRPAFAQSAKDTSCSMGSSSMHKLHRAPCTSENPKRLVLTTIPHLSSAWLKISTLERIEQLNAYIEETHNSQMLYQPAGFGSTPVNYWLLYFKPFTVTARKTILIWCDYTVNWWPVLQENANLLLRPQPEIESGGRIDSALTNTMIRLMHIQPRKWFVLKNRQRANTPRLFSITAYHQSIISVQLVS